MGTPRLLAAFLPLFLAAGPVAAATLPAGFVEVAMNPNAALERPTAMALAPDGRIFVCQQNGLLRVIENGQLLPDPFVSLTVDESGERGLLGVAFDPDFASNSFVYVYYTATTPAVHNRISRFTASGNVATGGETVLLDLNNLSGANNHNGGAIHFGSDGKLYAGVGENATGSNAQTLSNLLGKILRINKDPANLIPSDNPFFDVATGNNRAIWALGLRNPFTFAVQPGTGRIFVNDVGASTAEEVNDGIAGSNYGWPHTEGNSPSGCAACTIGTYRNPVHSYGHDPECAIAGGAFYDPAVASFGAAYVGKYFFADLCASWIKRLDPANGSVADFATGANGPVDLRVDASGNLYYLSRGNARVYRVSRPPQGDANADGVVSVGDVFFLINRLFAAGPAPPGPADVNGDGLVTVTDVFYLISYLFAGGPPPVALTA